MKFAEAAMAYELLQTGCTYRFVARQFGISNTHLGRVIRQCLELGKDAPLVSVERLGRPRTITLKQVKRAMVMRDRGMAFDSIGLALGLDPEQLRKSVWHYDNYKK